MRIVSKFHDFYDSVMAMDTDKKTIYYREEKEIIINSDQLNQNGVTDKYPIHSDKIVIYEAKKIRNLFKTQTDFQIHILGFCGELLPILEHDYYVQHPSNPSCSINEFKYYIGIDNITNFLETEYKDYTLLWDRNYKTPSNKVFSIMEELNKNKKLMNIFIEQNVPSFLYYCNGHYDHVNRVQTGKIILNPCLKRYQFQSYLDPYQTYQKIQQYMENILVQDKMPMKPISDELKRDSKGFDKHSFRKDPSSKKRR